MARQKSKPEDTSGDPARVVAASAVANRAERKQLLSNILRDGKATGAEAVAAARLLEAMERTDTSGAQQGIPAPTSRPEQVARIVRVLNGAGWPVVAEALEIFVGRLEHNRRASLQINPEVNAANVKAAGELYRRLRGKPKSEESNASRASVGPEPEPGGAASADNGLPELHQAAPSVGEVADGDEPAGT